jgi:hypothetical protein
MNVPIVLLERGRPKEETPVEIFSYGGRGGSSWLCLSFLSKTAWHLELDATNDKGSQWTLYQERKIWHNEKRHHRIGLNSILWILKAKNDVGAAFNDVKHLLFIFGLTPKHSIKIPSLWPNLTPDHIVLFTLASSCSGDRFPLFRF